MIKLLKETVTEGTRVRELGIINRMFERIFDRSDTIPFTVRSFDDATNGAQTRYLPNGVTNLDKDYQYTKTDSSANAVTIYPYGTQTINGAASYVLSRQYDTVTLAWDYTTLSWKVVSSGVVGAVRGTNTNDSAAAGYVGEYQSALLAQASAISLTTSTAADITSLSLTAGDWDVSGSVTFVPAATTTTSTIIAAINTTSATLPSVDSGQRGTSAEATVSLNNAVGTPTVRISIASTTTVYLVCLASFAVSTMTASGFLRARRVR